jgi:hypothetical protein
MEKAKAKGKKLNKLFAIQSKKEGLLLSSLPS